VETTCDARNRAGHLFCGQLVGGDLHPPPDEPLRALQDQCGEAYDIDHRHLLKASLGRHVGGQPAGLEGRRVPGIEEVVHEIDGSDDGARYVQGSEMALDLSFDLEHGYARACASPGTRDVHEVGKARGSGGFGEVLTVAALSVGAGPVHGARGEGAIDPFHRRHEGVGIVEVAIDNLGSPLDQLFAGW
jgi:hypothetical protein